MKRDYLYIDDREGNAVAGAEVYIKTGAGSLITLYSDNGVTTQTNPMSTDNDGECNFFAADGTYTIEVYVEGVLQQTVLGHQHYDESGQLEAANNLSDLDDVPTARTNLGLGTSATMAAEWACNFTGDADMYIPAVETMTISQGNEAIGTGVLAFEKSTAASPGTFSSTTLPVTLEEGAWLKVSATSVSGFVATHLVRTA